MFTYLTNVYETNIHKPQKHHLAQRPPGSFYVYVVTTEISAEFLTNNKLYRQGRVIFQPPLVKSQTKPQTLIQTLWVLTSKASLNPCVS